MNRGTTSEHQEPLLVKAMPLEDFATGESSDAIQLDSCPPFEQIVVRTCRSVYDVIVLSGEPGEVMIRGGRFFPEFRRARVAGSTAGGSVLMLRSICVGLHMELNVNGKRFVTSKIQSISDRGLQPTPNENPLD